MSNEQQWTAGGTDPQAVGEYMRQYPNSVRRCYWDGRLWYHAKIVTSDTKQMLYRLGSAFQFLPWRPV